MKTETARLRYFHVVSAIAAILAIASFMAFPLDLFWKRGILIAWLILPPLFFFIEIHWVRKHYPEELDNCKLSQDSASKIWAGVAAALALMFFDKH